MPSACRWLHITRPPQEEPAVSPPCSNCCSTHRTVAEPLKSTWQQLSGGLIASEVSGWWAGAHQHGTRAHLDLPWPGPLSPLQKRKMRPRVFLLFQQQNNHNIHTHTHIQVRYDLATIWMQWMWLSCYVLWRLLTTGVMYYKVIHCHAVGKTIWHFTHVGRAISL